MRRSLRLARIRLLRLVLEVLSQHHKQPGKATVLPTLNGNRPVPSGALSVALEGNPWKTSLAKASVGEDLLGWADLSRHISNHGEGREARCSRSTQPLFSVPRSGPYFGPLPFSWPGTEGHPCDGRQGQLCM